jgi:hypothetical protein
MVRMSRYGRRNALSSAVRSILPASVVWIGCHTPVEPAARIPDSLEIEPLAGPLTSLGATVQLIAVLRDQTGDRIGSELLAWVSRDESVVTVDAAGQVTAHGNGHSIVRAHTGDIADSVTVIVDQRVARIRIMPSSPVLELPGDTIRLSAEPVDDRNNPMVNASPVTWTGSGPVTATPDGLVTATAFGNGQATASAGGVTMPVPVEVIGDRFFMSNGVRLRYDLDLPAGTGPFPAIVFVHGSGPVTRNGQRDVTDPFVPHGVAAFRYDKRGVGESGGFYEGPEVGTAASLFRLLADDAANAARFLARLPRIDPDRIGLIGNSQGGWIVPIAALKAPETISYIMLWSGPTVSIGLEIFYSNLAAGETTSLDEVYAQLDTFTGPHGYDPLADIAALEVPGIWQYGALDRSIPMRLDVQRLAVLSAQGRPFETVVWPFGDHALRDVRVNQFYDVWSEYTRFMRDHGILPPL